MRRKLMFLSIMLLLSAISVACEGENNNTSANNNTIDINEEEDSNTNNHNNNNNDDGIGSDHDYDLPESYPNDFPFTDDAVVVNILPDDSLVNYASNIEIETIIEMYEDYFKDKQIEITEKTEGEDQIVLHIKNDDIMVTITVSYADWVGGDADGYENSVIVKYFKIKKS